MQLQTASEIMANKQKGQINKKKENPLLKMLGAGQHKPSHGNMKDSDTYIRSERDKWD